MGPDEIRDFFRPEARAVQSLAHLTGNHRIDIEGDRARGTAYHHAIGVTRRTQTHNELVGYYDDVYVRVDDRWLFASRRLLPLLPHPPLKDDPSAISADPA